MQCEGPGCGNPVEQAFGGHRQRRFCSDRCRMAASRWRAEQAEQARIQALKEAQADRERAELRRQYPMITAESIELLYQFNRQYGQQMVSLVGAALAREHDQAKANLARMKQERRIVEHQTFNRGRALGFPAIEALDLEAGEATWWVWVIDDRNDLAALVAALNVTAETRSSARPVTIEE